MLQTIATSDVVRTSLLTLWTAVAGFIPQLVAAIVVFLIGWLIAVLLGRVAFHIVKILQVNRALSGIGFKKVWERSGFKLDTPLFFFELVKWFFIVVFLMSATDILGLVQVTEFLKTVVLYFPNVIVAAIVLLIGILVARFAEGLVRGSVKSAQLVSANFLAALTKWSVVIFSFLIALAQLKVADEIIRIVVVGIVAAGALALGLSFGLGGQRHAEEAVSNLRRKISE